MRNKQEIKELEEKFLEIYNNNIWSTMRICESIGVERDFGYKVLQKYNLPSHKTPKKLEFTDIDNIVNEYLKGQTIEEVSAKLGIKKGTVNFWLRKKQITRPNSVPPNFNFNYFEQIDSPNKAYFLGLLYADGSVSHNKNWTINLELKFEDKYIIEKFAEEIQAINKVKEYVGKTPLKGYSKLKHNAYIHLGSKKMVQDLINLGCTPNKTKTLKGIPNIPKQYIVNFIMGFFDGDGIASYGDKSKYVGFCGTEDMMKSINDFISKELNLKLKHINYNKSNHIYYLQYNRTEATILYEWLYNNNDIYLLRKKEKFERIKK